MRISIINKSDIPVTTKRCTKWSRFKDMPMREALKITNDSREKLEVNRATVLSAFNKNVSDIDLKWHTTIQDNTLYVFKGELDKKPTVQIEVKVTKRKYTRKVS